MPTSSVPWWATWALAAAIVGAFVAAIFVFHTDNLLTALITTLGLAAGYYFGSSSDSSKKTDIIAASSPPSPQDSQATADALNAAEALGLKNRGAAN